MTTQAQPLQSQPDPMVAAFTARAQQQSAAPATSSETSSDPMLDAFTARKQSVDAGVSSAAAKTGAYQQTKGGAVRNAQDDLKHPFSESTTSILPQSLGGQTGAMMQRPDETYPQFMARAVETGKHVTQEQVNTETAQNKKAVLPTLVAAGAIGTGGAAAITYGAAAFDTALGALGLGEDAAADMGLREWVEQMGQKMPTAMDHLAGGAKAALQWMKANPVKTYFIYRAIGEGAHGAGKLLHLFAAGAE